MVDVAPRDEANRHLITLDGEVDMIASPRLHDRIETALRDDIDEVVVDLRDISFIDSTGLGVLINGRRKAKDTGVDFHVMLPEGHARFPFEVTGLTSFFSTVDEAKSSAGDTAEHLG